GIVVTKRQADLLVIKVNKEKEELQRTNLLAWIVRGETEKFKGRGDKSSIPALRPTLKSRRLWYALPHRNPAPILWIEVKKRRSFTLLNQAKLLADRSFYDVIPQELDNSLCCALLNSTITALFCEAQGNAPGGSGAGIQMTTAEVRRIMLLNPKDIETEHGAILQGGFTRCPRSIGPIMIHCPDRIL
ncbi:MAG: hypothetical protein LC132_02735, partial [Burkholderiales bacterium]|nr:hypothetical protein [Burkholderiales bacterium]